MHSFHSSMPTNIMHYRENWDPYCMGDDGAPPSTARYSPSSSSQTAYYSSTATTTSTPLLHHNSSSHSNSNNHHHHHEPQHYSNDYNNNNNPIPSYHPSYHGKMDYSPAVTSTSVRSVSVDHPPIRVHENDVLMGRGGKNNQHSGNEKLRQLARTQCATYRISSKKGKSQISRDLVQTMRDMEPPARFLKRDHHAGGGWVDVGDDIAREKASQVLRDAVGMLVDGNLGELGPPTTAATSFQEDASPDVREPETIKSLEPFRKTSPESSTSEARPVDTAASFPPATPLESSRKRHRSYYSEDDPFLFQQQKDLPDVELMASPARRRRSSDADDVTTTTGQARRHSNPHSYQPSSYYPRETVLSHASSPPYSRPREYASPFGFSHYHRRNRSGDNFMPPPFSSSNYPPAPSQVQQQQQRSPVHEGRGVTDAALPRTQLQRQSSNQHWRGGGRPQLATRQASAASCSSSLLGEVSGVTDFDLFEGELLDDIGTKEQVPKSTSSNPEPQGTQDGHPVST